MGKKLNADQLKTYLQQYPQQIDTFYCVMGDELLLRQEVIDSLRQHYRQLGFSERINLVIDANGPWHHIKENLYSTSLFAEQKILEITLPNGKTGRLGGPALIQLTELVNSQQLSDITIILNIPKLDKKTQQTEWFKAIQNSAIFIEVPNISLGQLPQWIRQRLALQQQTIDAESLTFLVEKVEGNLFAAHQEILKLGLMLEPGHIDLHTLQQSIKDVARFDVFQLTDAILSGDTKRSSRILQSLQDEGEALPLVLAMITREIRSLYTLAIHKKNGDNLSDAMRKLGIFSSRQTLFNQALQRLNLPKLMGLIQHASDIDRLFKGYPVEVD
ncbi:DNA polymerase III subunit delta [Pelistega indica]|uniref:DNA polymerase III subunit delta n=1 Tax=Pelistega indica TaxID=1414851 RepID=UPI000404418F|nr:DNA polymerase III subunit delta [Pelistega indica]